MPFTVTILAIVLSYTWFLQPRAAAEFVAVPVVAVLALGAWHSVRTGEWGLGLRGVWGALGATAAFTLAIVVIVAAAGSALGTLHRRDESIASVLALILWGGGQQWILQTVLLREAQRVTGRRGAIVVAAVLFASLHLPNPFLTTVTFIAALGWCAMYDRYPTILPLALSHAVATLAVLHAFDDAITGRLRVGVAYLMR